MTLIALLLALGTLAFPIEWALKYFVAIPPITLNELIAAMFNVGGFGLDDIAVFPAGHALRAMAQGTHEPSLWERAAIVHLARGKRDEAKALLLRVRDEAPYLLSDEGRKALAALGVAEGKR